MTAKKDKWFKVAVKVGEQQFKNAINHVRFTNPTIEIDTSRLFNYEVVRGNNIVDAQGREVLVDPSLGSKNGVAANMET